ncbi:hypothetical protein EBZ37_11695, partial [bacterium]|nr:hypothetical protein [bacterium]
MNQPHVRVYCWAGFLGNTLDWSFLTSAANLLETASIEILPLIVDPLEGENWGAWTKRWLSENPRSSAEFEIALGYSLGGRAAAHVTLEAPERWTGLIAISAHPGLESCSDRKNRVESDERWASRFEAEDWTSVLQDW